MSNYSLVLKALNENYNYYNEEDYKRDVDLICNLLMLKYVSFEREIVAKMLIEKINNCLDKKDLWFTNY